MWEIDKGMEITEIPKSGEYVMGMSAAYLPDGWDSHSKQRCFENRYYTPWRDTSSMEVSANSCTGSLEGDRKKRLAFLYQPET